MSIVTRTGDQGTTALLYGRRVPKTHPQVEACGAVDELNAALGAARSLAADPFLRDSLLQIQKHLVALMGELAVAPEDQERYRSDKYPKLAPDMLAHLEACVKKTEAENIVLDGWATPGATPEAAACDVARAVCRRAERAILHLGEAFCCRNPVLLPYMNRLSDLLWLFARLCETRALPNAGKSIPVTS
jgi:cob(I)alamin adenosyltransferase